MALTDKQQMFLIEYLKCFNATLAAIRAGYSEHTARSQGSRLLTNVDISVAIEAFKAERVMSPEETQILLTEQARSDMGDFLTQEGDMVTVDLPRAIEAKKTGLIKKLSQTRTMRRRGEDDVEETVSTTIELYDKQAALVHTGKMHGMFNEKRELSGDVTITVKYA